MAVSHEEERVAFDYDPEDEEGDEGKAGEAMRKHEARLMAIEGVRGVGVGQDAIGDPAVLVYVADRSVKARLPKTLDGVAVEIAVVGEIDAY